MRLGDRKFFNLFARLASETNPDHDVVEWKVAGANWRRQRHVYQVVEEVLSFFPRRLLNCQRLMLAPSMNSPAVLDPSSSSIAAPSSAARSRSF